MKTIHIHIHHAPTRDAELNPKISAAIAAEYKRNGGNIEAAFDKILGAGAYKKMAGEVRAELRARAGIKDAGHYGGHGK
jgi:hypothetical protein